MPYISTPPPPPPHLLGSAPASEPLLLDSSLEGGLPFSCCIELFVTHREDLVRSEIESGEWNQAWQSLQLIV